MIAVCLYVCMYAVEASLIASLTTIGLVAHLLILSFKLKYIWITINSYFVFIGMQCMRPCYLYVSFIILKLYDSCCAQLLKPCG